MGLLMLMLRKSLCSNWKAFYFTEVFTEIQRGKRLKKADHTEGDIPYVSSTSLNNGIDGFIGNDDGGIRRFENCLTLANSGSVGSAFYHRYTFVASDHVTKLKRDGLDKYAYLFLIPIINRLSEKYSFNREINDERIKREKLLLPATDKGEIDFAFMSAFMKDVEHNILNTTLKVFKERLNVNKCKIWGGTLSLLQAAKIYWESLPEGYEGKRFYHISTDEVYGALQMTHPEGIPAPFTTKASSDKNHEAYGEEFFLETTKYNPHSPYSASKASSDHFVRAFHDTYGMPTIVTNCSNNYGPYQFPEKLIPLFINNIRHRKPLPVYGKGENVRDWLYVVDHARAIDMIFHKGKIAETYNIGGFNEWKNIDIIKVVIKTVDRLLGRKEGEDMDLITYVTDRKGHDMRYAIDSRKLQKELGWEPSLQFEEGIEETVKWYLDNQEWMDNVTSGDYQKYYDNMYSNR